MIKLFLKIHIYILHKKVFVYNSLVPLKKNHSEILFNFSDGNDDVKY